MAAHQPRHIREGPGHSKAAAEIAPLAGQPGVAVAAEKQDFRSTGAELETRVGRRRARMRSASAYSMIGRALPRASVRRAVSIVLVSRLHRDRTRDP